MAALATAQHGVVARRQLLARGLSARMIERRLAAGRLHPVHRGVYALGHGKLSRRGRWMAAVLACGNGALLSHRSAAALWGLARPRGPVEVSSRQGGARQGLLVHRGRINREDRAVVDAIPVTSVARTLLDLAGILERERLERAWEEADRLGLLELGVMERMRARCHGHRGFGTIGELITAAREPAWTRSALEDRFAAFCREQRLPVPVFSSQVLEREADALWPRERLVVEMDGFAFHSHRAAFERDRARDAALQVAGYRVLRITHRRLEREPGVIAEEIRRLLKRGSS